MLGPQGGRMDKSLLTVMIAVLLVAAAVVLGYALLDAHRQDDGATSADPWGSPHVYEVRGERDFTIVSKGEDGVQGTADDLVWPPK